MVIFNSYTKIYFAKCAYLEWLTKKLCKIDTLLAKINWSCDVIIQKNHYFNKRKHKKFMSNQLHNLERHLYNINIFRIFWEHGAYDRLFVKQCFSILALLESWNVGRFHARFISMGMACSKKWSKKIAFVTRYNNVIATENNYLIWQHEQERKSLKLLQQKLHARPNSV